MPSFSCILAGANFRPGPAREVCKSLEIGEALDLEADPTNEYDMNAVKVLARGEFIGFIPKTDNAPVAAALNRGEELSCEVIAFESSIKPILEVTLP